MKKILITGVNSYIGTSLKKWLGRYPGKYSVSTIDLRVSEWSRRDFSEYDVVVHLAGIAHISLKPGMEELYCKVNRDLAIETVQKAKKDGIKQFIFMSSIIVYGDVRVIGRNTVPNPINFYGKSKLQAEEGIKPLASDDFHIAIIRPPMIYGRGSKGNYPRLARAAQKLLVFPDIDNQRSMLHIDNLCEFIRLIVNNEESGIFFPQNKEYVRTSEMVKLIAEAHGKKIKLVTVFNPALRFVGRFVGFLNKLFGNLVYEHELSDYKENYRVRDLKESIMHTERE